MPSARPYPLGRLTCGSAVSQCVTSLGCDCSSSTAMTKPWNSGDCSCSMPSTYNCVWGVTGRGGAGGGGSQVVVLRLLVRRVVVVVVWRGRGDSKARSRKKWSDAFTVQLYIYRVCPTFVPKHRWFGSSPLIHSIVACTQGRDLSRMLSVEPTCYTPCPFASLLWHSPGYPPTPIQAPHLCEFLQLCVLSCEGVPAGSRLRQLRVHQGRLHGGWLHWRGRLTAAAAWCWSPTVNNIT